MTFGVGEPFFSFPQLALEMTKLSLECAQIPLSSQVQHARHALDALLNRALDATAKAESLDRDLLNVGISQELRDSRVLKQREETLFDCGHRGASYPMTA